VSSRRHRATSRSPAAGRHGPAESGGRELARPHGNVTADDGCAPLRGADEEGAGAAERIDDDVVAVDAGDRRDGSPETIVFLGRVPVGGSRANGGDRHEIGPVQGPGPREVPDEDVLDLVAEAHPETGRAPVPEDRPDPFEAGPLQPSQASRKPLPLLITKATPVGAIFRRAIASTCPIWRQVQAASEPVLEVAVPRSLDGRVRRVRDQDIDRTQRQLGEEPGGREPVQVDPAGSAGAHWAAP
jgi:hypothetical protein